MSYVAYLCDGFLHSYLVIGEGPDALELMRKLRSEGKLKDIAAPQAVEVRKKDAGPPLVKERAAYYQRLAELAAGIKKPIANTDAALEQMNG